MILEGLVTTLNADGTPHLAPMGPRVGPDFATFVLRPFPTSGTYRNLLTHPEGVLHVTDDALLIAKAALGAADPLPELRPASRVEGFILADCCRSYEFVVRAVDTSGERVSLQAEVVHAGRHRDFWGFNRAKHAVVEAAILATRLHLIPHTEVAAEFEKLRVIVTKTGGPAEHEAMDFLEARLKAFSSPSPLAGEGSEQRERVRGTPDASSPHPVRCADHPLPQGERVENPLPPPSVNRGEERGAL